MDLKELPTELAHFVQQALASGTYQSADDLVAEAVRMLRDQEVVRKARQHTPDATAPTDVSTHTPDDLVCMVRQALETGEAGRARQLAIEGAQRYSDHTELQKYARVLAPPTTCVVPASPASRASLKAVKSFFPVKLVSGRGTSPGGPFPRDEVRRHEGLVEPKQLTQGSHVVLCKLTQLLLAPSVTYPDQHGKDQCEQTRFISQIGDNFSPPPFLLTGPHGQIGGAHRLVLCQA